MTPQPRYLEVELLSDTTFGRGEGTAGVVDVEVEHDVHGLPFLRGKALRGLLRDSWISMQEHFQELYPAARRVLGPHADVQETSILRFGDAILEKTARDFFVAAVKREHDALTPDQVLASLTGIREQTSEDRGSGASALTTLRAGRVILRGLKLTAQLSWIDEPTASDVKVLALVALATRHAGLARNRGRGHLRISLDADPSLTSTIARGVA